RLGHVEMPVQPQLIFHLSIQRRNLELGLQIEPAFHEGLALHRQAQDVPHIALRHVDVELDGTVGVAFVFEDGAAGGEVGGTQGGDYGFKDRVSVGAVHQNFEFSAERDRVAGTLQAEIRNVSLAAGGYGV